MSRLIFALFFILTAFAIPKEIGYRQLSWKDFKGKPDSRGVALSSTQISFETSYSNGCYSFEVFAVFLPDRSFTTTTKERILRHEQLHFDITELMVRRLRSLLRGVNSPKQADSLYQQTVKEWGNLEQQYDRETNFSINQAEQLRWEVEIAKHFN